MTSPTSEPQTAPESSRAAAARSFGPPFFFCLGALLSKIGAGVLPPFFLSVFDLFIYAGIAYGFAIAYRRFVRRTIEDRRRERARRAAIEAAAPADEGDAS